MKRKTSKPDAIAKSVRKTKGSRSATRKPKPAGRKAETRAARNDGPRAAARPSSIGTPPRAANPKDGSRGSDRAYTSFPVVGIGASAGGLEALDLFLKHVPERSGMAFV